MGVVIFFVLTLIAAGVVIYPLLPGRTPAEPVRAVTDGDIERAAREFRRTRNHAGLRCPACGHSYQAGDVFCVRCGGTLSQAQPAADERACPFCGAMTREGDQFCAKCGYAVGAEEVA
jgi:DNA-directed RNA polymerase subunit RPC12/RpoP